MSSEELRMDAYYYSFDSVGDRSIDRILSAVACAGKAFHSTDEWTSPCEPYHAEMTGNSCREWIQNAAKAAAAERDSLRSQRDAAVEALTEIARPKRGGIEANDSDEAWIEHLSMALERERSTARAALLRVKQS